MTNHLSNNKSNTMSTADRGTTTLPDHMISLPVFNRDHVVHVIHLRDLLFLSRVVMSVLISTWKWCSVALTTIYFVGFFYVISFNLHIQVSKAISISDATDATVLFVIFEFTTVVYGVLVSQSSVFCAFKNESLPQKRWFQHSIYM